MISFITIKKDLFKERLYPTLPQRHPGPPRNVSLASGNFGLAKRPNLRRRNVPGTSLASARVGLNKK